MFAQVLREHVRSANPDSQRKAAQGWDTCAWGAALWDGAFPGLSQQGCLEAWKQEEASTKQRSTGEIIQGRPWANKTVFYACFSAGYGKPNSLCNRMVGDNEWKGGGVQSKAKPGQERLQLLWNKTASQYLPGGEGALSTSHSNFRESPADWARPGESRLLVAG